MRMVQTVSGHDNRWSTLTAHAAQSANSPFKMDDKAKHPVGTMGRIYNNQHRDVLDWQLRNENKERSGSQPFQTKTGECYGGQPYGSIAYLLPKRADL